MGQQASACLRCERLAGFTVHWGTPLLELCTGWNRSLLASLTIMLSYSKPPYSGFAATVQLMLRVLLLCLQRNTNYKEVFLGKTGINVAVRAQIMTQTVKASSQANLTIAYMLCVKQGGYSVYTRYMYTVHKISSSAARAGLSELTARTS